MKTEGQKIIEHARAMQDKTLRSTLVKVRLSRELWGAIRDCAEGIGWPATEWCYGAILQDESGAFDSVAEFAEYEDATREGSESFSIRIPTGYQGDARKALARAVGHHKPLLDARPKITLIEGIDYITNTTPISAIKLRKKE